MTNLESNLYSIAFLTTLIKTSIYTLDETIKNEKQLNKIPFADDFLQKTGFPNSIRAIVSQYSIVQFCSLLDEYKNFNPKHIGKEYTERILKVRKINKYVLQRINKCKNLYEYRNQIAAHNFEIKKKSILIKNELTEYNIPDTLEEKYLFYKITEKMCRNIFKEFKENIASL